MLSVYGNCHESINSTECVTLNLEMYLSEDNVSKIIANVKV